MLCWCGRWGIARGATRERRRVIEGTAAAAVLSAAPSALISVGRNRAVGPAIGDVLVATRAAGSLVPPGRLGLVRGSVAHLGVSLVCGELLARTLPQKHSVMWGAGAGLGIGVVNLRVIGRGCPQLRALPLMPQLADNVAFGALFALVADRRRPAVPTPQT